MHPEEMKAGVASAQNNPYRDGRNAASQYPPDYLLNTIRPVEQPLLLHVTDSLGEAESRLMKLCAQLDECYSRVFGSMPLQASAGNSIATQRQAGTSEEVIRDRLSQVHERIGAATNLATQLTNRL